MYWWIYGGNEVCLSIAVADIGVKYCSVLRRSPTLSESLQW